MSYYAQSRRWHKKPKPRCPNGFIYTVVSGDTMFFIAQRFSISLDELIAANPQIKNPNLIFPGQKICVPKPKVPVCPGFLYTVVSGDTMFFIAQRFSISLDELIAANPQIKDPNLIFPGQKICIPVKPVPPPPPPPDCPDGFIYTIVSGDTLFSIARRFGISLDALIAANPQIKDPNLIFPGQRICVPFPPPPECPEGFIYTVQEGDTLFSIAQEFGITLQMMIDANPQIADPNLIFAGQRICVPVEPVEPPPPPPACPDGFIYTIVSGDTLFSIATRFGISLQTLIDANPQIEDPALIVPGQRICVPFPPPPECPEGFIYTVQEGDTMFSIATQFGITLAELIAANPQIIDPALIFPGQEICVPVEQ